MIIIARTRDKSSQSINLPFNALFHHMTVWSFLTQVRVRQKPDYPYLKSERHCRFDIRNQSKTDTVMV